MPKGYDVFSTMNPQQSQLLQQLLGSLLGQGGGQAGNIQQNPLYQSGSNYLQKLLQGGDEAFADFEAPFKRDFETKTIPGIAERYAGYGAGAQSSSAFQNALGQAGADLHTNLAGLRAGLQGQAANQALGYAQQPVNNLQNLLGMNTQAFAPKQQSFWQQLLLGLTGGAGKALGSLGTGGLGSLFGPKQPQQQGTMLDWQTGKSTTPYY